MKNLFADFARRVTGGKIPDASDTRLAVVKELTEPTPESTITSSGIETQKPIISPPIPVPTEPELHRSVRDSVDRILNPDDEQKIRYFFIRLFRDLYGFIPEIERRPYGSIVRITIPGKFKDNSGMLKILISEVSSEAGKKRGSKIVASNTLAFWNLKVEMCSIYSQWAHLDISTTGKIWNSDLENLRDFVENSFLREYSINESSGLDVVKIRESLELSEDAFLLMEPKFLEISFPLEGEIIISETLITELAIRMNAKFDEFGVKHRQGVSSCMTFTIPTLLIRNFKKGLEYEISFHWKTPILTLRVSTPYTSFSDFQLDRAFLVGPLKFALHEISHSESRKRSAIEALRDLGIHVEEKDPSAVKKTLSDLYDEEGFVGYEDVKKELASNIIYPWEERNAYIEEAMREFPKIRGIIPNAALFEGPPWTGKTTFAKIIGRYLGCPFIYVPIGKILSEWYSKSERQLDQIFELARKAAEENGGIVVMIDEIDEIGKDRNQSHEATGRVTGVLLKKLDGMEKVQNLLLIGSTNRKNSMDPALLSRFSRQVYFREPDLSEIPKILSYYLPQGSNLPSIDFDRLKGKSGRDIRNFAEDVARMHLQAKLIDGESSDVQNVLLEALSKLPVIDK